MRAVFLTHSSFSSSFRVGSHQLAHALEAQGWEVLHIPTPITPLHLIASLRNSAYRRRTACWWQGGLQLSARIREYIPLAWIPWQVARSFGGSAPDLYAASLLHARAFVRDAGFARPDLLFLDEPRLVGMLRWFSPARTLYRATDLYHSMLNDATVLTAERRALRETAGFVATSQPVYEHLKSLAPGRSGIVVENGVDLEHFMRPQPPPAEYGIVRGPKAVYVGALDGRFDFAAIQSLASSHPELTIFLIGPQEGTVKPSGPNIRLLGSRPYEQVPAYLQHADIGLLPLSAHSANRGRSPMKIYEYGAAGLPVIASRTEELERRALPFVSLYAEKTALASLVGQVLSNRPALSRQAVACAQAMTWRGQLKSVLTFSEAVCPVPPAPSPAQAS